MINRDDGVETREGKRERERERARERDTQRDRAARETIYSIM